MPLVSNQHASELETRGFTVLEDVLDADELTLLREECAYFTGFVDGDMEARDIEVRGLTLRGARYFIANMYRRRPRLASILYGAKMAEITRTLLGPDVFLFNEQWVVKGPEQDMSFAWHQDSGYVYSADAEARHAPYLTCWLALDDMSAANGSIRVLPFGEHNAVHEVVPHHWDAANRELVALEGDHGELLTMSAGSIGVFWSTTLHASGANTSDRERRVYLAQYSPEPITGSGGQLWAQAVPFVAGGELVYDAHEDATNPRIAERVRTETTL